MQVWQKWEFNIHENEGSQRAKYLSHDKLTSTYVHLYLGHNKKVKDHLTSTSVCPVALVWYVFLKWPFNKVKTIKNNSLQVSFTVNEGEWFQGLR